MGKIAILAPMDPRPNFMSIWELAHRWHGTIPSDNNESSITPAIRDTINAFLESVLNSELTLYEIVVFGSANNTRRRGPELRPWALEELPAEFEQMYQSGVYRRDLLAYYRVDLETVFRWALHNDFEVPDFCIPKWAYTDSSTAATQPRPKPSAQDKAACQAIAKRKWAESQSIRIAEMARDREIQIEGNGKHYSEATLQAWLREVAPDTVKGRPGRPSKASSEEN